MAQVLAQPRRLAGHLDAHQGRGESPAKDGAQLLAEVIERTVQGARAAQEAGEPQAQVPQQAGAGEDRPQQVAPDLFALGQGGLQRVLELGLQARLLVEADLQVGQEDPLGTGLGTGFEKRLVDMPSREATPARIEPLHRRSL